MFISTRLEVLEKIRTAKDALRNATYQLQDAREEAIGSLPTELREASTEELQIMLHILPVMLKRSRMMNR